MRILFLSILAILPLVSASDQYRDNEIGTPQSSPDSIKDSSRGFWEPIPEQLQAFIASFQSPLDDDIEKRQQVAPGGGAPPAPPPTQLSPITTYWAAGSQVVFTQTFAPTPVPWSPPQDGTIGLGTLSGTPPGMKPKSAS